MPAQYVRCVGGLCTGRAARGLHSLHIHCGCVCPLCACSLCVAVLSWGVIMYLRTGWMVGTAGVIQSIVIVILCSTVTTLTTLSLSAICTNGEVQGGGPYFLISRALGPEYGGAVGIMFYIANTVVLAVRRLLCVCEV